ncbi:Similar to NAGLU: Alpha-N-acetylglucosaminidase (Homo sapiens) [Cotesia congregata]|uniref:Alpha-N-acetylglucosaminidase n=1 Tax=Cotesia congregata TaxID=51543 RepID=A0A8J2HJX0_COTCN|nr:Similar to NAGLU: Alpha-N-acetylglucosaminidase (Homo sapiens) [Cotesia congregata]
MMVNTALYFIIISVLYSGSSGHHNHINNFESTLGHLKPRSLPAVQAEAALMLIERTIGEKVSHFSVSVDPNLGPIGKDTFEIKKGSSEYQEIFITGTSGVAVTWGFHHYLKKHCNCQIAWEGEQIELPDILPDVNERITSNDRFRYYQNVCTTGYSSAWWGWDQWEKNIDWMALNGINLALAFHGQEAIWERVYLKMNLTSQEINQHFGGPAFLPWSRMGNIRGWGGLLSSSWHNHTIVLQHRILNRMRELGIIPVLPAFAGHVPRAFSRIYPHANMTKIGVWNQFDDQYCCPYLVSPTDPLFKIIGQKFLHEYINEFGTDHIYNCDTFNENEPVDTDTESLKMIGQAIYSAMTDVDPQAIWMMQGWLFVHEFDFWTESRVEAFITSVPLGKMIILDLQSEQFPQYMRFKSYFGQPFIWCMLHNFGGTLGMFGSARIISERVIEARNMEGSTMIGTGLTPEGINQNYVIYELMNEMAYRREPVNLDKWFENYSVRRYGGRNEYASQTWNILGKTIYNFIGLERIRGHYVITMRPKGNIKTWWWYDPELIIEAWGIFLNARNEKANKSLYRHDVVDITRQALQLIADEIYLSIKNAYAKNNSTLLRQQSELLVELFDDLERILDSSENFRLGKWLEAAKLLGTNEKERELYEYNARNQITLWGPNGEICDYANKQWAGVIVDYFKPRWVIFLKALQESVETKQILNQTLINQLIFEQVENPFTFSHKNYPVEPQGDSVLIAVELNNKWKNYKLHFIERKILRYERRMIVNKKTILT